MDDGRTSAQIIHGSDNPSKDGGSAEATQGRETSYKEKRPEKIAVQHHHRETR